MIDVCVTSVLKNQPILSIVINQKKILFKSDTFKSYLEQLMSRWKQFSREGGGERIRRIILFAGKIECLFFGNFTLGSNLTRGGGSYPEPPDNLL